MIRNDLTEVLRKYGEWDLSTREKYLSYAANLMAQRKVVMYKDIEYHHIEDLKVDLEADCQSND